MLSNKKRNNRYEKCNSSKRKGRLAPSVDWKVEAHKRIIDMICSRLPTHRLVLETGSFDTQKLENPSIKNRQYQKGVQYGFENIKAYVLDRDKYKCQSGKSPCSKKLHVHHIEFRSNGGTDKPSNLITLCEKHHGQLHDGKLKNNFKSKNKSTKSATIMGIVRKRLLNYYPNAIETFGYVTKKNRYEYNIDKSHTNDAFVIAGGNRQERVENQGWGLKRGNNRSIQKNRKGFGTSIRKQRYLLQPQDIVEFEGKRYIVNGTHNKGNRCIIWIDGNKKSKKVESLHLIYKKRNVFKNN